MVSDADSDYVPKKEMKSEGKGKSKSVIESKEIIEDSNAEGGKYIESEDGDENEVADIIKKHRGRVSLCDS